MFLNIMVVCVLVTFRIRVRWRRHLALYSSHARLNDSGSTDTGGMVVRCDVDSNCCVVKIYDVAAALR